MVKSLINTLLLPLARVADKLFEHRKFVPNLRYGIGLDFFKKSHLCFAWNRDNPLEVSVPENNQTVDIRSVKPPAHEIHVAGQSKRIAELSGACVV